MVYYSYLYPAIKFISTLSCTQVHSRTYFSKLKYILNCLRNCFSQKKLDTFLLISTEKHVLSNIKNDNLINLPTLKSDLLKKLVLKHFCGETFRVELTTQ